jgi:hypothetical protein
MFINRITRFLPSIDRLPTVKSESRACVAMPAFVQAPAFATGSAATWQASLYQLAYEQARAQVAARRRYRALAQPSAANWN